MKKPLWKRMWQRLSMCMIGVLLALGIAIVLDGATPVQAAEKIPISSVGDLMNMESNPSGSYYLTRDITLPKNMEMMFSEEKNNFTGTLDGNGHKLKNYTIQLTYPESHANVKTGLFGYAKNATFKNFLITDVNFNINIGGIADFNKYADGVDVHPLVLDATKCTFDKIKVSGTITVKYKSGDEFWHRRGLGVTGLIGHGDSCKLTNCSSSLKINVSGEYINGLSTSGLAGSLDEGTVKNCSFSGNISARIKPSGAPGAVLGQCTAAGICAKFSLTKVSGCTNSGNITIKAHYNGALQPCSTDGTGASYGIGGGTLLSMSSCGNKGKIKADTNTTTNMAVAAGLVNDIMSTPSKKGTLTKCWNKGKVSATGAGAIAVGIFTGISNSPKIVDQCYNKGSVSASASAAKKYTNSGAGGLCRTAYRIRNSYNVGKVAFKGNGYAGGLAVSLIVNYDASTGNYTTSTGNYATGAVSAKKGGKAAALFAEVNIPNPKCYVYNNYYTASKGCKKAYRLYKYMAAPQEKVSSTAAPRAKKVSSITRKNCPKLSSKYWAYSSKYKRMVLKKNKEK